MTAFSLPTPPSGLYEVRFQVLSLVVGLLLAVAGALTVESAEEPLHSASYRNMAAVSSAVMSKQPATAYYVVTSAPSRKIPEEAVDLEQGGLPSNVTLYFRVIDSPESEERFLQELTADNRPYLVFDMR